MATITKTVGATGRDYTTIQAAIDAMPASLVTADESWVIELYADSEFTGSAPLIDLSSGHLTNSTHTITIKCGAGQSFYENAGKDSNALRYNASNGVAIRATSAALGAVVKIANQYVTLDGLQIDAGAFVGTGAISQSGADGNLLVKNCICEGSANDPGYTTYLVALESGTCVNCLVNTRHATLFAFVSWGATAKFYNCTAAAVNGGRRAFGNFSDSPIIKNCAAFGFTGGGDFAPGSGATSDYNASSDASAPGAHSMVSKTSTSQFVNFATTNWDLRVKAGADLIGAGVRDQTHTADLDILQNDRAIGTVPDGPTIGAHEYIAPAGGSGPGGLLLLGVG